jgi:alpha-L-fucosidase 2
VRGSCYRHLAQRLPWRIIAVGSTSIMQSITLRGLRVLRHLLGNPRTHSSSNLTDQLSRETFCSNPSHACSQNLSVSSGVLPSATVAWSTYIMQGFPLPNITCLTSDTLRVRGFVAQPGMLYELLIRASTEGGAISCSSVPTTNTASTNATLHATGARSIWLRWVGGTEYDMKKGNAASGYSFRGADPHSGLVGLLAALPTSYSSERARHVQDVSDVLGKFALNLGAPSAADLATPTDQLLAKYQIDLGNPYLETLTFNFGRYLLFSSARGTLPANLQGKWAYDSSNPWGADYRICFLAS